MITDPFQYLRSFAGTIAVLMVLIAIAGGLILAFGPKIATGDEALKQMRPEQRALARKFTELKPATALADLTTLLGKPVENQEVRVKWNGPVDPQNARILASFTKGKIVKLKYYSNAPYWSWDIVNEAGKLIPASNKKP